MANDHLLSAHNAETSRSRSRQRARSEVNEHRSMWNRLTLHKFGHWLKRDEDEPPPLEPPKPAEEANKENGRPHSSGEHAVRTGGLLNRRSSRKVVPGLPRPLTFKRMNSEKREKLLQVPDDVEQRRATSADRRPVSSAKRNLSPPSFTAPSMSAPSVMSPLESEPEQKPLPEPTIGGGPDSNIPAGARQVDYSLDESVDCMSAAEIAPIDVEDAFSQHGSHHSGSHVEDSRLEEELEAKWILNLSMHFRDMSDREKFFLTYAEEPNKWRRVTVSIDYRQLEPDSLEADLKTLHYQRDKSSRIYEAIRDSLPDIQFYDTVTNLKLQTTDGRLHVHVTEDVNEIIPYPRTTAIDHLQCKRFRENAVCFDSHISGFVYKVAVNNKAYIKKEIPGPDAVEEFLYEINALCSLQDSNSVIRFEGVIVDEYNEIIKGLIISYAEQGALIDMIYDFKPTDQLPWTRREKWARQIVQGLSEIHEAGYVQGDFTLSNIVIDANDDAKIIDINRRGCPVGWEPPELARLIESGQRISIYIGVKSDLFQLGMVLWAIAEQHDEPERQERPLAKSMEHTRPDVPTYFRDVVRACLSDLPRNRPSAANLLKQFPAFVEIREPKAKIASRDSISTHRSDKEYIDPATAVGLEDISQHKRHSRTQSSFENVLPPPTDYPASSGSYIIANNADRGRSPSSPARDSFYRQMNSSSHVGRHSVMSLDDSETDHDLASLPASRETRWEQIYIDGDTKLVQRGCGDVGAHDFAAQEPKEICITTPPGELENSFLLNKPSDSAHLTFDALEPIEPESMSESQLPVEMKAPQTVESKKSFSDRVHQLAQAQPKEQSPDSSPKRSRQSAIPDSTVLADLEHEVDLMSSVSTSTAPSRVGTGFSIFEMPERSARVGTGFSIARGHHFPTHQDSGFDEPTRVSFESERLRRSLDESIHDLKISKAEEEMINGRLWDEKEGTLFSEGIRGEQLQISAATVPEPTPQASSAVPQIALPIPSVGPTNLLPTSAAQSKALEERVSNTTIRPPHISIPDFSHGIPKPIDPSTNHPVTPPFSGSTIKPNTHYQFQPLNPNSNSDYLHDYFDSDHSRPTSRDHGTSVTSDLDDYLSACVEYGKGSDFLLPQYEVSRPTEAGTKSLDRSAHGGSGGESVL